MKPLTKQLKEKQEANETIFVPYIMAGAQGLDQLANEIQLLTKAGASAIELGIPFSDPVADGPYHSRSRPKRIKSWGDTKKNNTTAQTNRNLNSFSDHDLFQSNF